MEHGGGLQIGPLHLGSVMVTMLGLTVVLTLVSLLATRRMKLVPRGLQNVAELGIEMLDNFLGGLLEPKLARQYFPLLATLFIFILFANYSGILPLAGTLPGLAAPTSSLSVTVALAVVVFCATHFAGFRAHGLGYCKHFVGPHFFLLPLLVIEEVVRPVSLSLRLYGNILGEETVAHELFGLLPLAAPVLMHAISLLMGAIQAVVFVLLACIYIQGSAGEAH